MGDFAGVAERSGLKWLWLPGESVFVRTRTEVVAVHWVEGNKPRGFLGQTPFSSNAIAKAQSFSATLQPTTMH